MGRRRRVAGDVGGTASTGAGHANSDKHNDSNQGSTLTTAAAAALGLACCLGAVAVVLQNNAFISLGAQYQPPPPNVVQLWKASFYGVPQMMPGDFQRFTPDLVNFPDQAGATAARMCLQGRYESILSAFDSLKGRHERVLEQIASHPHFDPQVGCPMYYAQQYRNIPAMNLLASKFDKKLLAVCMEELDSWKANVVHSAAMSKASGFVRLFQRFRADALAAGYTLDELKTLQTPPMALSDVRFPVSPEPQRLYLLDIHDAMGAKDMAIVLDIVSRDAVRAGGWRDNTPLHIAAFDGRTAVIDMLLSHGALVDARNQEGRTPLHLCAASGFAATCRALLAAGASREATDTAHGVTPVEVARHNGFLALAEELQGSPSKAASNAKGQDEHRSAGADTNPETSSDTDTETASSGGWGTVARSDPWDVVEPSATACGVDRLDSLDYEVFMRDYVGMRRPVIVRLGSSHPHRAAWAKAAFLDKFGDVNVTVAPLPYAQTYGLEGSSTSTIRNFVRRHMDSDDKGSGSGGGPDWLTSHHARQYVFDGRVFWDTQALNDLAWLPPNTFETTQDILRQFILGPRGSGAPPHFHGNAVNYLAFGKKRWVLYPPTDTFFATAGEAAAPWFQKHVLSPSTGDTTATALHCVQQAGELLYVPHLWGHGVLNLANSIGYAIEFHP
eukprot:m.39810 g.39810  ORF g.39810 m.39810 type:complete len:673 (-) comp11309_c0_seq2:4-2022(-)